MLCRASRNAANAVFLYSKDNSEEQNVLPKARNSACFGICRLYSAVRLHCISGSDIQGFFFHWYYWSVLSFSEISKTAICFYISTAASKTCDIEYYTLWRFLVWFSLDWNLTIYWHDWNSFKDCYYLLHNIDINI